MNHRSILLEVAILLTAGHVAPGCNHVPASSAVQQVERSSAAGNGVAPRAMGDPGARDGQSRSARYLFGWGEISAARALPRGGTSTGAPVTLAPEQPLPPPEIASAADDFERDRAAILALAGDFRVSFHFLETAGMVPGHEPAQPYHSWATEHVRVIEDRGDFISLQHTLVMFFDRGDGNGSEPMVQKHWRQDWTYEDTDLHTFRGDRTWARHRLREDESRGTWTQAVWQVDDSPRYEAVGRWEHTGGRTTWMSQTLWRPLPRRESSVRTDYNVLEGEHRIIITPAGWIHEQHNWKRVAGDKATAGPEFLAREAGIDRYERIAAPKLTAADAYWEATGKYWAAVREAWQEILAGHDRFTLRSQVDGRRHFEVHFEYAQQLVEGTAFDPAAAREHARSTIAQFIDVNAPNP